MLIHSDEQYSRRSGAYAFQEPHTPEEHRGEVDLLISNTTVRHYLGIDKREGLITVGKRLLRGQYTVRCEFCQWLEF